jgi:hypothetical protein
MADRQSPTMVRNLDPFVWRQIRAEAVRHDLTAGALLSLIASEWLAEHDCATLDGPREPFERDN